MTEEKQEEEKAKKVKLNFIVSQKIRDRLTYLQEFSGSSSISDVMRKAVAIYDFIQHEMKSGGKIFVHYEGKEPKEILIL